MQDKIFPPYFKSSWWIPFSRGSRRGWWTSLDSKYFSLSSFPWTSFYSVQLRYCIVRCCDLYCDTFIGKFFENLILGLLRRRNLWLILKLDLSAWSVTGGIATIAIDRTHMLDLQIEDIDQCQRFFLYKQNGYGAKQNRFIWMYFFLFCWERRICFPHPESCRGWN